MSITARVGQIVLTLLGALCAVIALSVWFVEEQEPFGHDSNALISSFGAGMGLMVIVASAVGLSRRDLAAWLGLWVLPAFFVAHIALLGTWLPDGAFLVVSLLCLYATRPRKAVLQPAA